MTPSPNSIAVKKWQEKNKEYFLALQRRKYKENYQCPEKREKICKRMRDNYARKKLKKLADLQKEIVEIV